MGPLLVSLVLSMTLLTGCSGFGAAGKRPPPPVSPMADLFAEQARVEAEYERMLQEDIQRSKSESPKCEAYLPPTKTLLELTPQEIKPWQDCILADFKRMEERANERQMWLYRHNPFVPPHLRELYANYMAQSDRQRVREEKSKCPSIGEPGWKECVKEIGADDYTRKLEISEWVRRQTTPPPPLHCFVTTDIVGIWHRVCQ